MSPLAAWCARWGVPEKVCALARPGWLGLLEELMERGAPLGLNPGQIRQVKSKLGGLRFYISPPASKELLALIASIEERSFGVCEACGCTEGVALPEGSLVSLCAGCRRSSTRTDFMV